MSSKTHLNNNDINISVSIFDMDLPSPRTYRIDKEKEITIAKETSRGYVIKDKKEIPVF